MTDHHHTCRVLKSILRELCLKREKTRSFQTIYREELKPLDVQEFPVGLQPQYEQLMDQLDQAFAGQSSPEDVEDPHDPTPKSQESLIEDLIHLYARLQTHKAPYVNKTRFLDRLNDPTLDTSSDSSPLKGN